MNYVKEMLSACSHSKLMLNEGLKVTYSNASRILHQIKLLLKILYLNAIVAVSSAFLLPLTRKPTHVSHECFLYFSKALRIGFISCNLNSLDEGCCRF